MIRLPSDIIEEILEYLDLLSRIRFQSLKIEKRMSDILCYDHDSMIPIVQILDYYGKEENDRLSKEDEHLCRCLEIWMHDSDIQNTKRYLEIRNVSHLLKRNVERHFTETWVEYGAVLELKDCWSVEIKPPNRMWNTNFIDSFLAKKNGRFEHIWNYGYGDYYNR